MSLKVSFYKETQFKDSPVGRIPKEWEVRRLGEIAEIKNGRSNVSDAVPKGLYPFFDRSNVVKRSNKYLFDTEAVIIPGEGYSFLPKYYKGKFDLHQRAYAVFNFTKTVLPVYIYYVLQWEKFQKILRRRAVGFTALSLRMPILKNLPILLPPLEEQKTIARILKDFDDLMEVIEEKIKTYERIKKGLMKHYFSKGVFEHREFKDTPIGRIPKEWEIKKLVLVTEKIRNGLVIKQSKQYTKESLPITRIETISEGRIDISKVGYVKKENLSREIINEYTLQENDILFSHINSEKHIGKTAIYKGEIYPLLHGTNLLLIRPKPQYINSEYLYYFFQYLKNINFFIRISKRAVNQSSINITQLKNLSIPLPSLEEQKEIAKRLKAIDDQIGNLKEQKEHLQRIKKSFMENLLSGKVRVKSYEE